MKEITIEVSKREHTGKGVARKLRAARTIPAVLYGRGEEPQALEIAYDHFHTIYHGLRGENALINLRINGQLSDKKAVIRDIQHDPVYGNILHIDFQHISMDQKLRLSVPIRLHGAAKGVKEFGGILQWSVRELEVSCLPRDIPNQIDVSIDDLDIGDSIHVKDVTVPNVEFLGDEEETIVSVIPPTIIKAEEAVVAEAEVAPAAEEQAEPEVISEKKAEERQASKEKKAAEAGPASGGAPPTKEKKEPKK